MTLLDRVRAFLVTLSLAGASIAAQLAIAPAAHAQAAPSAFTSATRYDAMHRVTGTIAADPDGSGPLHFAAVRNTYDGAGRLIRVEKGELASWQSEAVAPASWTGFTILQTLDTVYDSQSRKVKETVSGGGSIQTVTQYSYDSLGNLECTAVRMNPAVFGSLPASACTQSSGSKDRITKNFYDVAGDLIQVREGVGTSLEKADATYSYTLTGKREFVIDGNGNRAQLVYDGHDRLSKWIFPSKARPSAFNDSTQATALSTAGAVNAADFEQYAYDLQGNRTSLRKRDATTIAYVYDDLNRLVQKGGAAIADVIYTYDVEGQQLTAKFLTGGLGITNAYDGFGELASTMSDVGGTARTLTFLYDADGNRTRITHPDAQAITYAYDGLDRLAAIYQGTGTTVPLDTFTYGANSLLASRSEGSAGSSSVGYSWDSIGRLSGQSDAFSGGSGNISWTLAYNPASQIATETRSNNAYAWDGAVGVSRGYTTNGLNQYTAAGPASFTYDANGNLTGDGTKTYAYDGENRLVAVTEAGVVGHLAYDPLGRLVQVTGSTIADRTFLYDGDALVAEYNSGGALQARYVHGSNSAADDPLIEFDNGGSPRWLHVDHLGSIVARTDSTGGSPAINTYDEYGIPGSGNGGRFGYTGQMSIYEVGLDYYKARIYSPTLGRFLQTDPVGYDGGINIYEYALDDPVNYNDPTGNDCCYDENGFHVTEIDPPQTWGQALERVVDVLSVATLFIPGAEEVGVERLGAKALTRAEQLMENKVAGKAGEAATRAKLGENVAGEQVSVKASTGRRARIDFVTKDRRLVESKAGNARLRRAQRDVKSDVDKGRPVTPVGENAKNAGLTPGEPIKMKDCTIDRTC